MLFSILVSLPVFAQPDYAKNYFPLIHEAELAIANHDYSSALKAYKEAFEAVPNPFAKDYFNAAVCASKLKQYEEAVGHCYKLAEKRSSTPYVFSSGKPALDIMC